MEELKMAACGVDCAACAQYRVTVAQNAEAAALLVAWFREQGWIGEKQGAEAVLGKAPLCKGCWNITGDCFWQCGCGAVDFRDCCRERKIDHCGACADFPCAHYTTWAGWHASHEQAMARLHALR